MHLASENFTSVLFEEDSLDFSEEEQRLKLHWNMENGEVEVPWEWLTK